ncbi:MAG: RNA polymerase sigma factor [Chthoniobacterales bacterium]
MSPEEFFNRALERYERPLIGYARGITGDLESARDAVQETFLRLSKQNIIALEPRLAPWLFFVCRNCALDHKRKVVRFSVTDAVDNNVADSGPSPAEEVSSAEDATQLRALVGRLPEKQQELVRLKFEAGLSYREIGEVMRMSVNNVGVQLHNAILTLRQQWNRANTPILP